LSQALTVTRCVPAAMLSEVSSDLEVPLNRARPSTYTFMAVTVCESVVPATMCTGEDTVAPLPGWQMVTEGLTELSVQLPPLVTPVPLSATLCGLLAAESVMVRVPVRVPTAAGAKVTLMLQVAPPARELPQLLVRVKSPVTCMLLMLAALLLVLLSVTTLLGLLEPTVWLAKVNEEGDTVRLPAPLDTVMLRTCEHEPAASQAFTVTRWVPLAALTVVVNALAPI